MHRRSVKAGVGLLATVAALAACGPVKMGAAATVGDQRITNAKVNDAVDGWQAAYKRHPIPQQQIQLSDPESLPRTMLSWLIDFRVTDRAARDAGVSTNSGEIDAVRAQQDALIKQESQGQADIGTALLALGVPPAYDQTFLRMYVLRNKLRQSVAPGSANQQQEPPQVTQALSRAARELKVDVSPRYGSYNVGRAALAPVTYRLSRAESGTQSS